MNAFRGQTVEELIAAVRAAIGPKARLMIDANPGYDALEAIALGNRVADLGIDWFEEPATPELPDAYGELRAGQPLPVAPGTTWHGRRAFAEAPAQRHLDLLQPAHRGARGLPGRRKNA